MKKKEIKKIFLFCLLFFIFTFLIFFIRLFLSEKNNYLQEEKFVDPIALETAKEENLQNKNYLENTKTDSNYISSKLDEIKKEEKEKKVSYTYIPEKDFSENVKTIIYKKIFDTFFLSRVINERFDELKITFYKENFQVRWRFKDRKIHIFWLHSIPFKEALSVGIHEFWHFYDIYILKKYVFKDLSDDFYDISWDETRVLKQASKNEDFVSGYAMTNRYEDFAESFNFYILQNWEFLKRAKNSEKLMEKYNFFRKYIFIYDEFVNTNYSAKNFPKYIWDTTKLEYNYEEFKKYLEKIEVF